MFSSTVYWWKQIVSIDALSTQLPTSA